MGEIVGAGLLAHVPTIVLPDDVRRELNNGNESTLYTGLHQLRKEVFDDVEARPRPRLRQPLVHHRGIRRHRARTPHRASSPRDELPRGMSSVPYDMPGQPGVRPPRRHDRRRDAGLLDHADRQRAPARSPTPRLNFLPFLQGDEAWLSRQHVPDRRARATSRRSGSVIAEAIAGVDLRVVLIASGALSHTFHKLRDAARPRGRRRRAHLSEPMRADADHRVIDALVRGDHAQVINELASS